MCSLKQAPRQFNIQLNEFILSLGFIRCVNDPCVYIRVETNGDIIRIGVYVDDIIITGKNITILNDIKEFIKTKFQIKEFDTVEKIVGIQIVRDRIEKTLKLHMRSHINDLLEKYNMKG